MSGLSSGLLVVVFLASAGAIWVAGVRLANATDALDHRLGIGSAFGGLILLALVTNLPEVAITTTAALQDHLGLAVGNLVGGIAIQTVVLALLDGLSKRREPLTFHAASLLLVLEASSVIVVVAVALMGTRLPASASVGGASPASLAILALWVGGLLVIRRAQHGIPWEVKPAEAERGRRRHEKRSGMLPIPLHGWRTAGVVGLFGACALVTLGAGVAIEQSGEVLAGRMGLGGAVFGATFLAAATALPELSTGLTSVRLDDNELAFSDIFGGNAFLPVLFLLADVLAGTPVLPTAARSDQWMAGLGIVVTAAYAVGLVLRPARKLGPVGPDSLAVVMLYALGIVGLLAVG